MRLKWADAMLSKKSDGWVSGGGSGYPLDCCDYKSNRGPKNGPQNLGIQAPPFFRTIPKRNIFLVLP